MAFEEDEESNGGDSSYPHLELCFQQFDPLGSREMGQNLLYSRNYTGAHSFLIHYVLPPSQRS